MKTCGTCLNYRMEEVSPISGATTVHDYCVLDCDRVCGYHVIACDEYDADEEYIKFMRFEEDPND